MYDCLFPVHYTAHYHHANDGVECRKTFTHTGNVFWLLEHFWQYG